LLRHGGRAQGFLFRYKDSSHGFCHRFDMHLAAEELARNHFAKRDEGWQGYPAAAKSTKTDIFVPDGHYFANLPQPPELLLS
jgi:hypothetical protein